CMIRGALPESPECTTAIIMLGSWSPSSRVEADAFPPAPAPKALRKFTAAVTERSQRQAIAENAGGGFSVRPVRQRGQRRRRGVAGGCVPRDAGRQSPRARADARGELPEARPAPGIHLRNLGGL